MTTVTISLPDSLREFVDHQVAFRGYGNVSEYFRTLLRDAQEKERSRWLEEILVEGLDSREDIPLDDRFWRDLRTHALRLVEDRKAKRAQKQKKRR